MNDMEHILTKNKLSRLDKWDKMMKAKSDLTLVLPTLKKKPNISHILRTAHVFGVRSVYIVGNENRRVKYNNAGVYKWLDIHYISNYHILFDMYESTEMILADSSGDIQLESFLWPSNPILFLGREDGFNQEVIKDIPIRVKITQYGLCESLNVGVAASIFLFHHRQ